MAELPAITSPGQRTARTLLIIALAVLGLWTLRRFAPALTWSVILGVATWPWYTQWTQRFTGRHRDIWAALTFTTIIAIALIVPLTYALVVAAREALIFIKAHGGSNPVGFEMPVWLAHVPWIGDYLQQQWIDRVDPAESLDDLVEPFKHSAFQWTRVLGIQVLHRVVTLAFTILIVFFVYLNGDQIALQFKRIWDRVFGPTAAPLLSHAVSAIRAAVDGIVLVAVGEGALMYAAYAIAGVEHPVLLGALTGVFAMIPFAAPLVFISIALVLAGQGSLASGIAIVAFGSTMLFVVDHFVRPVIIGGTARLPFLWVLLGILGGVESFGLVGLFIGPALMAALCSLWRDWASYAREQEELRP